MPNDIALFDRHETLELSTWQRVTCPKNYICSLRLLYDMYAAQIINHTSVTRNNRSHQSPQIETDKAGNTILSATTTTTLKSTILS